MFKAILKRLQENGLVIRFDKCTFGAEKIDFLGHERSTPHGLKSESNRKESDAADNQGPSRVPRHGELLSPFHPRHRLHHVSPDSSPEGQAKNFDVDAPQQQAFEETKTALASATTLTHHDPTAALRLTTDASNIACGQCSSK
ncbi:uncharacterized protein [Macrobrachium rosenbergii]|uniref:uncharacterized protein n=1 Tax=Macrobrachium rosenbergii TaxID=79674 RepID=UPI0034D594E3